jgi:hypothetical protein
MEKSGQFHSPVALAPGERVPGTHWIGGWVGPRAGLDAVEKRKILSCRETNRAAQPVAIPTELSRLHNNDIRV